jgi:transcriptional regulator with XRE-family HTH domain
MTATTAQRLTFPISPEYYKGWTSERAIAEIVANARDESSDFTFAYEDGVLTIEDDAAGIGNHGLLMGLSRKTDTQIGQWGEGLNASCLVLSRERGIGRVRVETVGYSFTPTIVRHQFVAVVDDGQEAPELLALDIEPNTRAVGTKVTVECTAALAEKVRARFRFLNDDNYCPPQGQGVVLDEVGGRLYIGGVFVSANPKLMFSYDFPLALAKQHQNRDRTVLDGHALDHLIRGALTHLEDEAQLERWVGAALDGKLHRSEQCFYGQQPKQLQVLHVIAKRLFAGRKVTWSEGYRDEEAVLDLRDRGYEVLKAKALDGYSQSSLFAALGVKKASALYHRPRVSQNRTTWTKRKDLSAAECDILDSAVKIVRGAYGVDAVGDCNVYESTRLEGADTDLRWGGFYEPTRSGKIGIQRQNLESLEATLDVLVHEAGHRLRHRRHGSYDFADRTRGFEWQLGQMACRALIIAHEAAAIPDVAAVAAEDAKAQAAKTLANAKHPAQMMRTVIDAKMTATGLTQAELASECGVSVGTLRQLRSGTKRRSWAGHERSDGAPELVRTRAVAEYFALEWSVVHLAMLSENLWTPPYVSEQGITYYLGYQRRGRAQNGSRGGSGRVFGRRGEEMEICLKRLQELGVDTALITQLQEQLDHYFDGSDGAWLRPYRTLVRSHAQSPRPRPRPRPRSVRPHAKRARVRAAADSVRSSN